MNNSTIIPIPKYYSANGDNIQIKPHISTTKKEWQNLLDGFCQCAKKYTISISAMATVE